MLQLSTSKPVGNDNIKHFSTFFMFKSLRLFMSLIGVHGASEKTASNPVGAACGHRPNHVDQVGIVRHACASATASACPRKAVGNHSRAGRALGVNFGTRFRWSSIDTSL
ncbi:uncharacterized protein CLUP02_04578 [Colletotrichum lupini]|uniref:Uncharacterized protein n=1 Tax=Colletotrichum lupini TaxID=145971 RepID=A0A9Q8SKK8_9PEZI|nr:uncharacterized protein CLUP02_04578 [Colletotrichum lupini]UQC79099.1 hypothetical protein CLUP02_04578 [Colletotrichum lupini]